MIVATGAPSIGVASSPTRRSPSLVKSSRSSRCAGRMLPADISATAPFTSSADDACASPSTAYANAVDPLPPMRLHQARPRCAVSLGGSPDRSPGSDTPWSPLRPSRGGRPNRHREVLAPRWAAIRQECASQRDLPPGDGCVGPRLCVGPEPVTSLATEVASHHQVFQPTSRCKPWLTELLKQHLLNSQ